MADGPLERLDRRLVPGLLRRPDVMLLLIGALFLAAGATRYQMVSADAGQTVGSEEVVTVGPAAPELGGDDGAGTLVGPPRGAQVQTYVATRREYLGTIAQASPIAQVAGIVSFDRYMSPGEIAEVLSDSEVRGLAARYRLPVGDPFEEEGIARLTRGRVGLGTDPAGAITAALRAEADDARIQAEELEAMIASADDEEFAQSFDRDRKRLLAAAAMVGESGCLCVYALELQGPAAALHLLAEDAGVRLVDIAPPQRTRGTITFVALLPEERAQAGRP